jgi:hypothetical protein
MCLSSRFLAVNVYSDFTIPAFGRHVTVFYEHQVQQLSLYVSRADFEAYPDLVNDIFRPSYRLNNR